MFCTCSLLPDEGEAIAAAIPAATGLIPDPAAVARWPDWQSGAAGLRLRPDLGPEGGMDGFFIAAFRRAGGQPG